jgi:hypothetical protein
LDIFTLEDAIVPTPARLNCSNTCSLELFQVCSLELFQACSHELFQACSLELFQACSLELFQACSLETSVRVTNGLNNTTNIDQWHFSRAFTFLPVDAVNTKGFVNGILIIFAAIVDNAIYPILASVFLLT